jgi:putative transcriptional regulator
VNLLWFICFMGSELKAVLDFNQPAGLDELLGAYSAGTLDAPLQALVASHLFLNKRNRSFVRNLEHLAARDAFADRTAPLSSRDRMLADIFERPQISSTVSATSSAPQTTLPKPLYDYVGHDLADVSWKRLLPGVKEAIHCSHGAGEVSFLWVKAGGSMPVHSHQGSEYTLVLKGSFQDETGHYGVGDIAIADADINHRPQISRDEDCICFVVTDAPLRLTGPFGRIFDHFINKIN